MHRLAVSLALVIAVPAFADSPKKPAPAKADDAKKPDDAKPAKPVTPPPFGKAKDSLACQEYVHNLSSNRCLGRPEDKIEGPCKAEFHSRVEECKKRPADAKYLSDLCHGEGWRFPDPKDDDYCNVAVLRQLDCRSRSRRSDTPRPTSTTRRSRRESGPRT
jgi:hypothetical protein